MTPLSRAGRAVPGPIWLRDYDRRWLPDDLVAGAAAGAVVIPQAMAYATIADLPVEVGLYTCMVPMIVYALLGGSRTLSVSTTSTVAVLTASTLLAAGVAAESADPAGDLAMLTLLVGAILLTARLLALGSLIDNISEATLTGIKLGVGLTVAAGQLPKLIGVPGDPEATSFFAEVRSVLDQVGSVSGATIALSVVTVSLLVGSARWLPHVPGPLLAVVLGIGLVAVASIDDHGVALIAPVTSGLPAPLVPSFDRGGALLPGAFAIAIMCFLETAAVGRSVRRPTEPAIDNDRELAANGLACIAGAFFRAMPSAGGFSQTAVNQQAGAKSQISSIVTAGLAVGCVLLLGDVLSKLPEATLGAMVVVAVLGLIRPAEIVRFWKLDRVEFWVMVGTAATGLCFNLLIAVLVGVVATLYLVLRELAHGGLTELQPTAALDDVRPVGDDTVAVAGALILRFDTALYTANVRQASRRILAAVEAEGPETLIIDMSAVVVLPVTVLDEIVELERQLASRGTTLWLVALPRRSLVTAMTIPRWHELQATGRVHPTALAAIRVVRAREEPRP